MDNLLNFEIFLVVLILIRCIWMSVQKKSCIAGFIYDLVLAAGCFSIVSGDTTIFLRFCYIFSGIVWAIDGYLELKGI